MSSTSCDLPLRANRFYSAKEDFEISCTTPNCITTSTPQSEDGKNENNQQYQFGHQFVYNIISKMKSDELYCSAKYKTIEEEATHNPYYSIRKVAWDEIFTIAKIKHSNMQTYCKANNILPKSEISCFYRFGIEFYAKNDVYWNERFLIPFGTPITVLHLSSLILFFNDWEMASAIRQTFRSSKDDKTFDDVKHRHSHFVNIVKHIYQAIYLYGHPLQKDKCVYRGVSIQLFPYLDAFFSGPLSTTVDVEVARSFSINSGGCVLTLNNSESGFDSIAPMYIDGSKGLSAFPGEKEYLMFSPYLKIINICPQKFKRSKFNFQQYISAMILFQKVIKGELLNAMEKKQFMNENICKAYKQLMQSKHTDNKYATNTAQMAGEMQYINKLWDKVFDNLMSSPVLWICESEINSVILDCTGIINCILNSKEIIKPQIFSWNVTVADLKALLYLNSRRFLLATGYLKQYHISDCEILQTIDEYCGKMSEDNMQWENEYKCSIGSNKQNEVGLYLIMEPSLNSFNNKWYNVHIVFHQDASKIELKKMNLVYGCDLLCDQMDICLHFCRREISKYAQRSQNRAFSYEIAQRLINNNVDTVWRVAVRFCDY